MVVMVDILIMKYIKKYVVVDILIIKYNKKYVMVDILIIKYNKKHGEDSVDLKLIDVSLLNSPDYSIIFPLTNLSTFPACQDTGIS